MNCQKLTRQVAGEKLCHLCHSILQIAPLLCDNFSYSTFPRSASALLPQEPIRCPYCCCYAHFDDSTNVIWLGEMLEYFLSLKQKCPQRQQRLLEEGWESSTPKATWLSESIFRPRIANDTFDDLSSKDVTLRVQDLKTFHRYLFLLASYTLS